ncbi:MAG: YggS family pyridoxal phosphate-dependent enzyme [Eubacteriales bacterium]
MIKNNIRNIHANIEKICTEAERSVEDVTLIAVSKTKPVNMVQDAYDVGIRDFGENKVQEIIEKYECLPKDIRWHMIGHLQRNKVKYIVDKVFLIHSVDSLRLAEEISKEAKKKNIVVSILIEVNVANEESKYGVSVEDTISLITNIAKLPNIMIKGLMTIAPFTEIPNTNRMYFENLKQLFVDIQEKNIDNVNMTYLSMGMSGDYEVAIQEGSHYVRVGTSIFGGR